MFVEGGHVNLCVCVCEYLKFLDWFFFHFKFIRWLFGNLYLFGDKVVVLTDNLT